ncbi:MAG: hypothetical protein VYD85_15350, partial [Pseudomonadota bacterium]|nr:hypothetical protein [Pseudomonadota bacterium]
MSHPDQTRSPTKHRYHLRIVFFGKQPHAPYSNTALTCLCATYLQEYEFAENAYRKYDIFLKNMN